MPVDVVDVENTAGADKTAAGAAAGTAGLAPVLVDRNQDSIVVVGVVVVDSSYPPDGHPGLGLGGHPGDSCRCYFSDCDSYSTLLNREQMFKKSRIVKNINGTFHSQTPNNNSHLVIFACAPQSIELACFFSAKSPEQLPNLPLHEFHISVYLCR